MKYTFEPATSEYAASYRCNTCSAREDHQRAIEVHVKQHNPQYVRKTTDEWVVEQNFGHGWEAVFTATTRDEMLKVYRDYLNNTNDPTRWKKRRARAA